MHDYFSVEKRIEFSLCSEIMSLSFDTKYQELNAIFKDGIVVDYTSTRR